MTKLKFNPMLELLNGAFGGIVFRQTPAGRTFISLSRGTDGRWNASRR